MSDRESLRLNLVTLEVGRIRIDDVAQLLRLKRWQVFFNKTGTVVFAVMVPALMFV